MKQQRYFEDQLWRPGCLTPWLNEQLLSNQLHAHALETGSALQSFNFSAQWRAEPKRKARRLVGDAGIEPATPPV
jgi:hypothetical protein